MILILAACPRCQSTKVRPSKESESEILILGNGIRGNKNFVSTNPWITLSETKRLVRNKTIDWQTKQNFKANIITFLSSNITILQTKRWGTNNSLYVSLKLKRKWQNRIDKKKRLNISSFNLALNLLWRDIYRYKQMWMLVFFLVLSTEVWNIQHSHLFTKMWNRKTDGKMTLVFVIRLRCGCCLVCCLPLCYLVLSFLCLSCRVLSCRRLVVLSHFPWEKGKGGEGEGKVEEWVFIWTPETKKIKHEPIRAG
jgi:hypothetical protein